MTRFPDKEQAILAWQSTLESLNLARDATLRGGEISVFFKHLLMQELKHCEAGLRCKSSLQPLRDHVQFKLGALQFALRLNSDFMGDLRLDSLQAWYSINSSKLYQQRLLDFVLATMVSENLAPDTCLEYEPWSPNDLATALPGIHNHAVIFADAILFHHEFYPLAVDAYVRDAQRLGARRTNVVGAHIDWLSPNGTLRRILFLDAECDRLREVDLTSPIHPDSVQFHSLARKEKELHQHWSERLSCPQVNPYGPSSLADDKAATLAGWAAMGIEVPAFVKLGEGDFELAWRFVKACREIVVKPNKSTESDGVAYFKPGQNNFEAELVRHLQTCWRQGEAIIQERRDGLIFRDGRSGSHHNLVLRLNVAFDGERYHVESGYVQLGRNTEQAAARSQGGRIAALLEIAQSLFSRTDSSSPEFSMRSPDWIRICDQAVRAASLFHGLLLVGLDVVLDLDADGNIRPVFLEANPRPAGLCHSRLLDGYPDSCPAPNGVSLRLWDGLERLRQNTTPISVRSRVVFENQP